MANPVDPMIGMQANKEVQPATAFNEVKDTAAANKQRTAAVTENATDLKFSKLDELRKKAPKVYREIEKGIMYQMKSQMDRHRAHMKRISSQYKKG